MNALDTARQLACPKCGLPMHVWESNGLTLDHCHHCKGLWFDAGASSKRSSAAPRRRSSRVPAARTSISPTCTRTT